MPEEKQQAGLAPINYDELSKSVHEYDRLQNQYGGKRGGSAGSTYLRDTYNDAWSEYKEQFPDATKESFRNVYTHKVEDEANITPWQQRKRDALEHAGALAAADQENFRKKQSEEWGALDPAIQQARGRKALGAIKDMKHLKSDDLKRLIAKKHRGGYGGGEDISPEEFNMIQGYLESRKGTNVAAESDAALQSLYGPIKRSPFKQIDYNLVGQSAAAGLGSFAGAGVQAGLDQFEADQLKAAEEERKAFQDQARRMQYAEMMAKQQEGLVVAGDTGINQADQAISMASRQLVDQAASLTAQLNNGDITPDEWAAQTATIRSQIPALKSFKSTLESNMAEYQQALQNGDLSAAMDPQADALYGALLQGTGAVQLGVDPETGQVTFGGTLPNGEQVSIPASGIAQMPKPILKAADPYEALEAPFKEFAKNSDTYTPSMQEAAEAELERILSGYGTPDASNKALLSLAVDRFGIPMEEAKGLLQSYSEDGNPLFERVKDDWVGRSKIAFESARNDRQKEELAIRNKELQNQRIERAIDQSNQQFAWAQEARDNAAHNIVAAQNQQGIQQYNNAIIANQRHSLITNPAFDPTDRSVLASQFDIKSQVNEDTGDLQLIGPDGTKTIIPKDADRSQARAIISRLVGAKPLPTDFGLSYDDQGNIITPGISPMQRQKSPFKKAMEYISNVFKREKETPFKAERPPTKEELIEVGNKAKKAGVNPLAAFAKEFNIFGPDNPEDYARYKKAFDEGGQEAAWAELQEIAKAGHVPGTEYSTWKHPEELARKYDFIKKEADRIAPSTGFFGEEVPDSEVSEAVEDAYDRGKWTSVRNTKPIWTKRRK